MTAPAPLSSRITPALAPPRPPTLAAKHFFGLGGNGRPLLRQGWSQDERGHVWGTGERTTLSLPIPPGEGRLILELTLNPMLLPPRLPAQTLTLEANGVPLCTERFTEEGGLGVEVPERAIAAGRLDLTLIQPDAIAPATLRLNDDSRQLGFALRSLILFWEARPPARPPRTLPPLNAQVAGGLPQAVRFLTALNGPELAMSFESLGRNCELGLVQRALGAEPLGLLRFANIGVAGLLNGLDAGFENLAVPDNFMTFRMKESADAEVVLHDLSYRCNFHTNTAAPDAAHPALIAENATRIGFLQRKFLEVLESGEKIFVFQHPRAATAAQVRPLLTLLRAHGPNTLLYVSADPARAGTVTMEEPDLLHGFVPRFAPDEDVPNLAFEPWVSVLANAYRLWRESGRG